MKLGTWTTIDAPTDKIDEAFKYLKEKFNAIDGKVRMCYNDHDFGEYPSFEIDYPSELTDYVDYDDYYIDEMSDEEQALVKKVDKWQNKANAIEDEYNKKFSKWL
jgi:hypothetical protein